MTLIHFLLIALILVLVILYFLIIYHIVLIALGKYFGIRKEYMHRFLQKYINRKK